MLRGGWIALAARAAARTSPSSGKASWSAHSNAPSAREGKASARALPTPGFRAGGGGFETLGADFCGIFMDFTDFCGICGFLRILAEFYGICSEF